MSNKIIDTFTGVLAYFVLMTISPKVVYEMEKAFEKQKQRKARKMRYMRFSKRLARESENVL